MERARFFLIKEGIYSLIQLNSLGRGAPWSVMLRAFHLVNPEVKPGLIVLSLLSFN